MINGRFAYISLPVIGLHFLNRGEGSGDHIGAKVEISTDRNSGREEEVEGLLSCADEAPD